MYETEANSRTEDQQQIAPEGIAAFAKLGGQLLRRTNLSWGEHCTECVWPTCYTTCDLYTPREDGRCRRFHDGMVRIDSPQSVNGYILKIRFKQWGKLWTPGNLNLRSMRAARTSEDRDYLVGTFLAELRMPPTVKTLLVNKRYGWKKRLASRIKASRQQPTAFVLECYNPTNLPIPLSLTIRSVRKESKIPFQMLVDLPSGYLRVRIPISDIADLLDLNSPFNLEVMPGDTDREVTLYFGLMDFVEEIEIPAAPVSPIKCVVWDLDNTVWDGILVEDGATNLRPKPHVVELIEALDRGGILQSIASKNNREEALDVLKHLGIDHFFLVPQISWSPKSLSMVEIARELNIGIESLLFVDDSEFELQEVSSACSEMRVMNVTACHDLLNMVQGQAAATTEGTSRREAYLLEFKRKEVAKDFKDDYMAFLRYCDIKLGVGCLNPENLIRVHELTQRTNQMNFSGNRYDLELLRKMMDTPSLDTYVLTCEDRFGSYGIVGFGVVDRREPRLTDLMFSCRIQAKRIEHAFLAYIMKKHITDSKMAFRASYRRTPRNEPSGKVFSDLGLREDQTTDGVTSLTFPAGTAVPDDGIVTITLLRDTAPAGRLV